MTKVRAMILTNRYDGMRGFCLFGDDDNKIWR